MSKELEQEIEDRIEQLKEMKKDGTPHTGLGTAKQGVSKEEAELTDRDISMATWELTRILSLIDRGRIDV